MANTSALVISIQYLHTANTGAQSSFTQAANTSLGYFNAHAARRLLLVREPFLPIVDRCLIAAGGS